MAAGVETGRFTRSEGDGVITLATLLGGAGLTVSQLVLRVLTGGLVVGGPTVGVANGLSIPNDPNRPLTIDFSTPLAEASIGLIAMGGQSCTFEVLAVYAT